MKRFLPLIAFAAMAGVALGDDPQISVEAPDIVPFNMSDSDNSFKVVLRNLSGSNNVSVEILEGRNWLKIGGTVYQQFAMLPGESKELAFTIDRYMLGINCGFATVRFSTEDQQISKTFVVQSGTRGGGFCLYSTDFENMEDGSILKEPCWIAAGAVNNCLVMEDPDDPENRVLKIGQSQALHTKISSPSDAFRAYDLKISMRVKYPSDAPKSTVTFGTELTPANRYGEYSLRHADGGIRFTADNCDAEIDNLAPYDKWFTISYSFNTDPENPVCRFVTFNGVQHDINKPLNLPDGWGTSGCTTEIRNYTWNSEALYYIDDLKIELVKAGTVPEPSVVALASFFALFLFTKRGII